MNNQENTKLKVLILDDDPINMLILSEMLKSDYLLFHALTCEVAYELAEKIKFDAILIDLYLGDNCPDGVALYKSIKKYLQKECVTISISSSVRPSDRINMLEEGFMYHFQKPLSKIDLINAIEQNPENVIYKS